MKKTNPVKARPTHSEYVSNSFQTFVLFILTLGITAYSLAGSEKSANDKNTVRTATTTQGKLSTGNRTAGYQIARAN